MNNFTYTYPSKTTAGTFHTHYVDSEYTSVGKNELLDPIKQTLNLSSGKKWSQLSMLERNNLWIKNKKAKIKRERASKKKHEVAGCSFEPKLTLFEPEKLEITPLIGQDPEIEQKMSSSLERIMNQKRKDKKYTQIYSDRLRHRSLEKEYTGVSKATFYKTRQEFVNKNHKEMFIKPSEVKLKHQTSYTATPSPKIIDLGKLKRKMSKVKAPVASRIENTFADITNLSKAVTSRQVQGNKPIKKKKSKIMVMKKKASTKRQNGGQKLNSKNGVIHLKNHKTFRPDDTFSSEAYKSVQSTFREVSQDSRSDRFEASSTVRSMKQKLSKRQVSSLERGKDHIPISERLIPNKNKKKNIMDKLKPHSVTRYSPYIFVGSTAYTQKENAVKGKTNKEKYLTKATNLRNNSEKRWL